MLCFLDGYSWYTQTVMSSSCGALTKYGLIQKHTVKHAVTAAEINNP